MMNMGKWLNNWDDVNLSYDLWADIKLMFWVIVFWFIVISQMIIIFDTKKNLDLVQENF